MKRTFDTFIFDLDGTLLDTLADLISLTNKTLQESGFPERSKNEILSFIGDGLWILLRSSAPKEAADDQVDLLFERWQQLYPQYGKLKTKEFPGISKVLREFKNQGKKLAVLSNKFDKGVHDLIPSAFPGIFDAYYGVSDAIPRKPDPQGLLGVISELGADFKKVAYVGDSVIDIEVARAAGVASIGVSWGYQPKADLVKAQPFALIDTPDELRQFG